MHEHVLRSAEKVAARSVVREIESGSPIQSDEEKAQELGSQPPFFPAFLHEVSEFAMGYG
jgi:hypothetical protein